MSAAFFEGGCFRDIARSKAKNYSLSASINESRPEMSFPIKMRNIVFALSLLSAAACSNDEPGIESLTPQQIFLDAEALLEDGSYEQAADMFSEIERIYPYSDWARRGTVLAASAYNAAGEFEKSRIAAERFLSFYPGDEDAALAQFLIAMSYYELVGKQGRDRANAINALQYLNDVIDQYPDSEYAKSAKLKFDLVIDLLAAKEMEVGRYYLKRRHYAAAIKRFQIVVDDYSTTTHVQEALHRLVESYLSLGLEAQAREMAAVLAYNYRGSEWYEDTYRLFDDRGLEPPDGRGGGILAESYRRTILGEWL